MTTTVYDGDNPVVNYAESNLWGNPEENHQHQVDMVRISDAYGAVMNFPYMGKHRTLPMRETFFHVYTIGGLHPGFWNIRNSVLNRNPLDRWVNLGAILKDRGFQMDIYNSQGFQFSRSHSWAMVTYDGLVLIALQKFRSYPIPLTMKMFFRCYTPSIVTDFGANAIANKGNPYSYDSMTYENATELATFTALYSRFKNLPGFTGCFYNGVFRDGAPNSIPGMASGDLVEVWHDPTVIRVELYNISTLRDYYSNMDKKRKLILHPPKTGNFTFRYFDDNDYYVVGPNGYGLYLNRNNETTIRQLTHVDVAVAGDALAALSNAHKDLADLSKCKIMVLVRDTDWTHPWPHEHQRIRYLYRLDDNGILKAMTGPRALIPEWTADGLESGTTMALTNSQMKDVKRERAGLALGYNATTQVVSDTPLRVSYSSEGVRGIEVPPTYRKSFTAWEYDKDGLLLGWFNQFNTRYYSAKLEGCELVEFTFGQAKRKLDYTITNQDVNLDPEVDFRVYRSAWSVNVQALVGELVDVTGDDKYYTLSNGQIHWTGLDTVNERGVILYNSASLAYQFTLDHIDHSQAFALTVVYEDGGLIFPIAFAQVDLWVNRHPLIDKVDWIYKDGYCYIHNKEWLVDGAQTFTVRAHGFHSDKESPKFEVELGYVQGGVIGNFSRYNLRDDRVTRTVINGSLYPTNEVPDAERQAPDNQWSTLNGRPYMVKHVYCPVKYVEPYEMYPGYDRSRDLDQRITDYMTEYAAKPVSVVVTIPNLQDKYRLYSPFMNVLTNGLINKIITLPKLEADDSVYSEQELRDTVAPYLWWLGFDPAVLPNWDRRYFAIHPFANLGKLTMTAHELLFLKQVNDSYLNSVCVIEGHYTVNDNVR